MKKFLFVLCCLFVTFGTAVHAAEEEELKVFDASGNGNDSYAVQGTLVADGKIGGAIQLNGDGDLVRLNTGKIADTPFLHTAFTEKTVALWFKAAKTSGRQMLFEQGGSVNGLALRIIDGELEVGIAGNPDGIIREVFATPFTDTDNWNHVLVSYDKGQVKLYLNGELKIDEKSTVENVKQAANDGGFGATIGNNNAFNENADPMYFEGLIDDARLYTTVVEPTLSDGDIILPEEGLEGWYKFDEGAEADAGTEAEAAADSGTKADAGNSNAADAAADHAVADAAGANSGSAAPSEAASNPKTSDSGIALYVVFIMAAFAALALIYRKKMA